MEQVLGWDDRIRTTLGSREGASWSHEADGPVGVEYPLPYDFNAHGGGP